MIGTLYVAHILFCSLVGSCQLFQDKEGPSMSREACHVKLDVMLARIQDDPSPIVAKIGAYDSQQIPRGFCINITNPVEQQWEVYFTL